MKMTGPVIEPLVKTRKRKRNCFGVMRKRVKKEQLVTLHTECCFCHGGENKDLGMFFQDEASQLAVHQYCLFFSAGLPQRGEDEEGFDGFLLKDLYREANRANKIECKFCCKVGANSGCSVKSCRSLYHYNCGKKSGAQFVFAGAFDSYCNMHRSHQDLSSIRIMEICPNCPLCLEEITQPDHKTILKAPCCKNVFMHRNCIQIQASVSGYFFRCPTCNNEKLFSEEMARYGIYVPLRDAAWEESNAFTELLEQYSQCDLQKCKCRRGRKYNTQAGKWHILRCYACGQSAVHVTCLGNQYIPGFGYICVDCNQVICLAKSNVSIQSTFEERWKEHKRLLQELKARDDPVLLTSPVFGAQIWRKRYNIRPCHVKIENYNIAGTFRKRNRKDILACLGTKVVDAHNVKKKIVKDTFPTTKVANSSEKTKPCVQLKNKENTFFLEKQVECFSEDFNRNIFKDVTNADKIEGTGTITQNGKENKPADTLNVLSTCEKDELTSLHSPLGDAENIFELDNSTPTSSDDSKTMVNLGGCDTPELECDNSALKKKLFNLADDVLHSVAMDELKFFQFKLSISNYMANEDAYTHITKMPSKDVENSEQYGVNFICSADSKESCIHSMSGDYQMNRTCKDEGNKIPDEKCSDISDLAKKKKEDDQQGCKEEMSDIDIPLPYEMLAPPRKQNVYCRSLLNGHLMNRYYIRKDIWIDFKLKLAINRNAMLDIVDH